MSDLLHPDDLIRRLRLNKHRCFIVTGRPGEGKTRYAQALAARANGQYIDLLALFAADPQRAAELDVFTPQHFKAFLQDYYGGAWSWWMKWNSCGIAGMIEKSRRS